MKKPAAFVGDSLKELMAFPPKGRQEAGHQIYLVELGEAPVDWKPLKAVGPGAREIRVRDEQGQYRVVYVAKFDEAVYVLHCFAKKTQKTPQRHIDLARARYQSLQKSRAARKRPS